MKNILPNVRLAWFWLFIALSSMYTPPTLGQEGHKAAVPNIALAFAKAWNRHGIV